MMLKGRVTAPRAAPAAHSRVVSAHRFAPAIRAVKLEKEADVKEKEVEEVFENGPDVAPSTMEVQQLLNTLVVDTEIAEMELKMGSFQLRVRRNIDSPEAAAPAPVAAPAAAAMPAAPAAAAPAAPAYMSVDADIPYESIDEAKVYVTVPKVGVFRRGKYAGGKKIGKGNVANVGDTVKKGQTLGYVEQLGTFVEVKAPQAGELTAYKSEDGDAVEYAQVVVEISPYFGGHIIGDSKYA